MTLIEISGLHKRYGPRTVLHEVSLSVTDGEIVGIVGPNGAGKTTTVECLAGLRARDGGTVRVAGFDPGVDRRAARLAIGVQLQDSRLPDRITVAEAMHLYQAFYPHPVDGSDLLDRMGLAGAARQRFGKLSGGQRQRLSVALALVGRPRIAILDELTTGLDPQARRDTWQLIRDIRAGGVTVVLVSHAMDEVERLCDRVVVLRAGRVVTVDTPAGLVAAAPPGPHPATLEDAVLHLTGAGGAS